MNTLLFEQEKKKTVTPSSDNSLSINDFLVNRKTKSKPSSMVVGCTTNKKQRIELPQEKVLEHVLIIGANGQGQMNNFVYPNVVNVDNSFIIVDRDFLLRPEMPANNQGLLIYDFDSPLTEHFNWILLCQDVDWAYSLAEATLIKAAQEISFHSQGTINFLAAIYCHSATLENPTPGQVYNLISKSTLIQIIDMLFHSTSIPAKKIAESLVLQAVNPKVLEQYLINIRTSLEWLKDPKIVSFTESDIAPDFSSLRREKICVYLGVQDAFDQIPALYRLMLTTLIKQLKATDGMPVYLFISHLAQIYYLSCLEDLRSLTKHKIGLIASLHSTPRRWEYEYGKESAINMLNACYSKIILNTYPLGDLQNLTKQANASIENNILKHWQWSSSETHLLFLGDNPAIVADTPDGSKLLVQLLDRQQGITNKLYKSDISLLAKLLCLLVVVLSIVYLAWYILFRVY